MNSYQIGDPCPFGTIDCLTELAPGVWSVGTEEHGGIYVEDAYTRHVPKSWPERQWFEEDSEWVMAAVAFPHAFPDLDPFETMEAFNESFPELDLPFASMVAAAKTIAA